MALPRSKPQFSWELAAEIIVLKIRWLGLLIGFVLVITSAQTGYRLMALSAVLAVGAAYALVDTLWTFRGKVLLSRMPLLISAFEAVFISLLCYWDQGLDSPFRYYYFLSIVCAAVRYPPRIAWTTGLFHAVSVFFLYEVTAVGTTGGLRHLLITWVMLGWLTWASVALARLLKGVGEHLDHLNRQLEESRRDLETRIEQRTAELRETQAMVIHQEKMAAFGLLAAGIAHEVGNPLASISSLVQMLQRHTREAYGQEKLRLVAKELSRIQQTLRELIHFSRPGDSRAGFVSLHDVVSEAMRIAKYYKRTKRRQIELDMPIDLPRVRGRRDVLVQMVVNLLFNAIDATDRDGRIRIAAEAAGERVFLSVIDNGCGIPPELVERIFQPFHTTKSDGTGLGLFVTRKLAREMGGEIRFTTEPGRGTTFTIELPAGADTPANSVHLINDEKSL